MQQKSIQELENDYWPELNEYPSSLIESCYKYRTIKIEELEIHQMITLLIQDIGSQYLTPIVVHKMNENILEEDPSDGSSFLQSFEFFDKNIFKRNPHFITTVLQITTSKRAIIENELGIKYYDRIVHKLENIK